MTHTKHRRPAPPPAHAHLPDNVKRATLAMILVGTIVGSVMLMTVPGNGSAEVSGILISALFFGWLISAFASLKRSRAGRWQAFMVVYAVLWFLMVIPPTLTPQA